LRKISAKNYNYMFEVLPPLTVGVDETINFLITLDKNPELAKKIRDVNPVHAFMQGEGYDNHNIYVETKDEKYFVLGKTKNKWNTEIFRYNDWSAMTPEELKRYNWG